MKLKLFDRITLIILMLAVIAASAGAIFLAWFYPNVGQYVDAFLSVSVINKIIVTVVALLVLFFCFRILFVRKRAIYEPEDEETARRRSAPGILIRSGEAGTSFLSIEALEAMITKFVRSNTKVRDSQCKAYPGEDNVSIALKLVPAPDVVIPELTTDLQNSLKAHIESMTGITVHDVQIVVGMSEATPAANTLNRLRVE